MLAASSSGSAPRAMVPEIGQVSTRSPVDPHVHLRRRPDQVLASSRVGRAEVEQELERRRVPLAQPLVEPRRRRAPLVEHVAGDDLEQVTATEALLRLLHHRRVPAGYGLRRQSAAPASPHGRAGSGVAAVSLGRPAVEAGPADPGPAGPGSPRRAGDGEVVGVPKSLLAAQVDDPDLVRQVQHQVPLVVGPVDRRPHRLELERQVVPERAVQPQVRVRAAERGGDLPQHAEHGGPPRPLLLGERLLALGHEDGDRARRLLRAVPVAVAGGWPGRAGLGHAGAQHRVADDRHQHPAAVVECPRGHLPAPAGDLNRRVDVGHVPAGVPAGVLHARAEHAAAAAVDERGDPGQLGRVELVGGAGDRDAASGRHRAGVHRVGLSGQVWSACGLAR